MVQIVLRSSKTDLGTLAVRIVNRTVGMNTFVSMHLKIKTKDWSDDAQLPKNIYDERSVKELNGMSYAKLAVMIQDIKKVLVALDDANTINAQHVKSVIKQRINSAVLENIQPQAVSKPQPTKISFMDFVARYVHECETGERLKQKSSRKMSNNTLKGFRSLRVRLQEYQEEKKRVIDWDDVDMAFYNDFKQWCIDRSYKPNTISGFLKKMKTILFAAKDLHLTTRDDFTSKLWYVGFEDVDNIYIPHERLKEMYELDLSDVEAMVKRACKYSKDKEEKKNVLADLKKPSYLKRLADARDIFLMGCLTGQRVSDYKRINKNMLETIQGDRKFIHLVQTKTLKDVYIPYDEMIQKILDKQNGQLPTMSEQHLNKKIKVVGLLLGWTEPSGLKESRGAMEYTSCKRFCDAISSHTARRSFATNAYKSGVSLAAIMAVTGHSSEDTLRRYLKLNTKERALLAAEEFDKVKKIM